MRPRVGPCVTELSPSGRDLIGGKSSLVSNEIAFAMKSWIDHYPWLQLADALRGYYLITIRNIGPTVKPQQVDPTVARQQFFNLALHHRGVLCLMSHSLSLRR